MDKISKLMHLKNGVGDETPWPDTVWYLSGLVAYSVLIKILLFAKCKYF